MRFTLMKLTLGRLSRPNEEYPQIIHPFFHSLVTLVSEFFTVVGCWKLFLEADRYRKIREL